MQIFTRKTAERVILLVTFTASELNCLAIENYLFFTRSSYVFFVGLIITSFSVLDRSWLLEYNHEEKNHLGGCFEPRKNLKLEVGEKSKFTGNNAVFEHR